MDEITVDGIVSRRGYSQVTRHFFSLVLDWNPLLEAEYPDAWAARGDAYEQRYPEPTEGQIDLWVQTGMFAYLKQEPESPTAAGLRDPF
jgi:hypothetical protein